MPPARTRGRPKSPDFLKVGKALRRDLDKVVARQVDAVARIYGDVLVKVYEDLDAYHAKLRAEAARLGVKVEDVAKANPSWALQARRLESTVETMTKRIADVVDRAEAALTHAQRAGIQPGLDYAQNMAGATMRHQAHRLGRLGRNLDDAFNDVWARPSLAAFETAIGYTADGTPLRAILAEASNGTGRKFREALLTGFVGGKNPIRVAREVGKVVGGNAARVMRIARTETIRFHRVAAHDSYQVNKDLVTGWIWQAALDNRTCVGCVEAHGSRHPLGEILSDHPNGRCTMIPIPQTMNNLATTLDIPELQGLDDFPLEIETGADWLARQPTSVQRSVLGPGRYQAYRGGVGLDEMVQTRDHAFFGPSIGPKPVYALPKPRPPGPGPTVPPVVRPIPRPPAGTRVDRFSVPPEIEAATVTEFGGLTHKATKARPYALVVDDPVSPGAKKWGFPTRLDTAVDRTREAQARNPRATYAILRDPDFDYSKLDLPAPGAPPPVANVVTFVDEIKSLVAGMPEGRIHTPDDAIQVGQVVRAEVERRAGTAFASTNAKMLRRIDEAKALAKEKNEAYKLLKDLEKKHPYGTDGYEQVKEARSRWLALVDRSKEARKAVDDLGAQRARMLKAHYLEVMGEIRPMGGKVKWGNKVKAKSQADFDAMTDYYPTDWIDRSNDFRYSLKARARSESGVYGSYDDREILDTVGEINLSPKSFEGGLGTDQAKSTAVHELFHRMEHVHRGQPVRFKVGLGPEVDEDQVREAFIAHYKDQRGYSPDGYLIEKVLEKIKRGEFLTTTDGAVNAAANSFIGGVRVVRDATSIVDVEKAYFLRRTASDTTSTLPSYGGPGKPDEWCEEYMGRIYPRQDAWEIGTRMMQGLAFGDYGLWDCEREAMNMVLGMLAVI